MHYKILIIEDDSLHYISLENELKKYASTAQLSFKITISDNGAEATTLLSNNHFDLVFFDLNLNGELEGLQILEEFNNRIGYPVVLTSHSDESIIEKAYESGCKDFLVKPFSSTNIDFVIKRFLSHSYQRKDHDYIFSNFITDDHNTIDQLKQIPDLRSNTNPTHLFGPTGVGKQVVAEIIHQLVNNNGEGNLIEANCSALGDSLTESTLFGHKRGSFTGADRDKRGLFELADGGTLFLDEIGKMPLNLQDKLLKVIEQKRFRPLGSENDRSSSFTLISASCEDLDILVKKGLFRPDLKERLTGIVITIAPLKERKKDISLLLQHFIKQHPSGRVLTISTDAKKFLEDYMWPGNVRELKQLVDKWQSRGLGIIKISDLEKIKKSELKKRFKHITEDIISEVINNGLEKTIDNISSEIVDYFYRENLYKARSTMKQLKISSRRFYKLRKEERQEEKSHE